MFLFLALLFRTQVKYFKKKKKTSMERLKGAGSRVDRMQLNGCLPLFHRPSRTVPCMGNRGFSLVRQEFSVLAEGRNRARKVSGTRLSQGKAPGGRG